MVARLVVLGAFVAVGAALGINGLTSGNSSDGLSADAGKVGDCFTAAPNGTTTVHKASCSSPKAAVRVIALAPSTFLSTPDCPENTDSFVENTDSFGGKVACVVNLRGTHPGAPGAGGGVIRPGDCIDVSSLLSQVNEVPCAQRTPEDPKVLARVDSSTDCPAATKGVVTLQGVSHPVLCLDESPPPDQLGP